MRIVRKRIHVSVSLLDQQRLTVAGKEYSFLHILTALQKYAYLNILRILPPKNENFQMKSSGNFHISKHRLW